MGQKSEACRSWPAIAGSQAATLWNGELRSILQNGPLEELEQAVIAAMEKYLNEI